MTTLDVLAKHYREHKTDGERLSISELNRRYRMRRKAVVAGLAVISSGIAIRAHLRNAGGDGTIDPELLDPQVREAFLLAFPNQGIDKLAQSNPNDLEGHLNAWSGKLFEVKVRDRLNDGEWVGELGLEPGQIARLAESPTQAGWDLEIVPPGDLYQLKATEDLHYIRTTVEENLRSDEWQDLGYVVTDDVHIEGVTIDSGISDDELDVVLNDAMETAADHLDTAGDLLPWIGVVAVFASFGLQSKRVKAKLDRRVPLARIAKEESGSAIGRLVNLVVPVPMAGRTIRVTTDYAIWSYSARKVVDATTKRVEPMVATMRSRDYKTASIGAGACCPPPQARGGSSPTTGAKEPDPKPHEQECSFKNPERGANRPRRTEPSSSPSFDRWMSPPWSLREWRTVRRVSFLLWGFAWLLLLLAPQVAFFVWCASVALWLVARLRIRGLDPGRGGRDR